MESHWNSCQYLQGVKLKDMPKLQQNKKENYQKKINFSGSLFKQERFLTSDTLYTDKKGHFFLAECCYRASMKKMKRNVLVHVSRKTSLVEKASFIFPVGKSGYYNHLMALLHELAKYSL